MASIELRNVHLDYPIREHRGLTLKEFLLRGFFRRRNRRPRCVHALTNLSLRIDEGERVGIIGGNGAGKSTLLRTIAGVYPISQGQRIVHGSVRALFDIAVGLEQEATGLQNIRYRSYLQGETPRTVEAKLHEIRAFCELGEHLDLPLRCYSSGKIMRLAFSIATSNAPEILLIDEVFSAGDLAFQQKAAARMRDFIRRARIVVMVGHQLDFLREFCTRVVWLERGHLRADGPAEEVIEQYRASSIAGNCPSRFGDAFLKTTSSDTCA